MVRKTVRLVIFALIVLVLLVNSSLAVVKNFRVQETDLVKVEAEAVDLDGDKVVYYYSPPLDDKGEWQTTYDDAGEYELKIIASDGVNQIVQKVNLIVENKNQPPVITDGKITIKETQKLDLKKMVFDPDDDPLSYLFEGPFDKNGEWETTYDDEGSYVTTFTVSDGEFDVKNRVGIEVLRTNRPPEIVSSFAEGSVVNVKENEELNFFIAVKDGDDDKLTYGWELDEKVVAEESSGKFYFDFDSSGEYLLKLTVMDGTVEIGKEWLIEVEDVNRKPELSLLPVIVEEGEKVILDLPDLDLDGDSLSYSFEPPLNEDGEWQTTYDDAGEYELEVIASDGELKSKEKVEITVVDVDQAPGLELPEQLEVNEGEKLSWEINTADPDGDKIAVSFAELPPEAEFDQETKTLTWTPGFDFIKRRGGLFSNALSLLKLEHFFLKKKTVPISVTSCGKELCTSGTVDLVVYNVNRAPEFTLPDNLTITETELVDLEIDAVDPDDDIVRVSFSEPLRKRSGKWKTGYDDEGKYEVDVTATDGKLSTTKSLQLNVLKNNRPPTLNVGKDNLVVNEGQQFTFKVSATDPDEDNLSLRLDDIPPGASFTDGVLLWEPPYNTVVNRSENWWNSFVSNSLYFNKKFSNEKATVWLSFVASDGELEVVHPVKVTVKNVNKVPEILDYLPDEEVIVRVNEPLIFHITVKDLDNDKLNYEWDFGFRQAGVKGTDTVSRTFTSPGKKKVRVAVDDGRDSLEKEWVVNVLAEEEVAEPMVEEEPFTVKVYVVEG